MKNKIIALFVVGIFIGGYIILNQPLPNVKQDTIHLTTSQSPAPVITDTGSVTTPTPTPPLTPVTPTTLVSFSGDANTQTNVPDITVDDTLMSQGQIDSSTFVPTQAWTLTISWTCTSTSNNGKTYPSFAVYDTQTNDNIGDVWDNPTQELSGTVTIPETFTGDTLQIETYVQPCTWTVVAQ